MLSQGRLFRWGIVFWVLAWIISILVSQSLVVNLKGRQGMRFSIEAGSVHAKFNSYGTGAFNYIRLEKTYFLWSERHMKHLRKHPEDFLCILGRVGWSGYGYDHAIAFPVAGFLWLWLIGGWLGGFKRIRRTEFLKNGHIIRRATILIWLPMFVLFADHRGRAAHELGGCVLNVRNIQQAMRSHQGVRGMSVGNPIDVNEVIGPGRYLDSYVKNCPSGQPYRIKSYHTNMGEIAAECPNPEHLKRLKEEDTSEW